MTQHGALQATDPSNVSIQTLPQLTHVVVISRQQHYITLH